MAVRGGLRLRKMQNTMSYMKNGHCVKQKQKVETTRHVQLSWSIERLAL